MSYVLRDHVFLIGFESRHGEFAFNFKFRVIVVVYSGKIYNSVRIPPVFSTEICVKFHFKKFAWMGWGTFWLPRVYVVMWLHRRCELFNAYMHCFGCEVLLSKDLNLCLDCHTKGKLAFPTLGKDELGITTKCHCPSDPWVYCCE